MGRAKDAFEHLTIHRATPLHKDLNDDREIQVSKTLKKRFSSQGNNECKSPKMQVSFGGLKKIKKS